MYALLILPESKDKSWELYDRYAYRNEAVDYGERLLDDEGTDSYEIIEYADDMDITKALDAKRRAIR